MDHHDGPWWAMVDHDGRSGCTLGAEQLPHHGAAAPAVRSWQHRCLHACSLWSEHRQLAGGAWAQESCIPLHVLLSRCPAWMDGWMLQVPHGLCVHGTRMPHGPSPPLTSLRVACRPHMRYSQGVRQALRVREKQRPCTARQQRRLRLMHARWHGLGHWHCHY